MKSHEIHILLQVLDNPDAVSDMTGIGVGVGEGVGDSSDEKEEEEDEEEWDWSAKSWLIAQHIARSLLSSADRSLLLAGNFLEPQRFWRCHFQMTTFPCLKVAVVFVHYTAHAYQIEIGEHSCYKLTEFSVILIHDKS